jgi:hypothetical protein
MRNATRSAGALLLLLSVLPSAGARAQNLPPGDTAAARQVAAGGAAARPPAAPADTGAINGIFLDTISPASAERGTIVRVWGRFPANPRGRVIGFEPAFSRACPPDVQGCIPGGFGFQVAIPAAARDSGSMRFVIPPETRFGYYRVWAGRPDTSRAGRVYAPTPGHGYLVRNDDTVRVRAVLPAVAYGDGAVEAYLDVQGLSPIEAENQLILNGQVYPPCTDTLPGRGCQLTSVDPDGHTLRVRWLKQEPNPMKGLVKVQVRVGNQVSPERTFIISMVKERTPAWTAAALLALVVAGVLALLWPLTKVGSGAGSRRAALSTIAFLDRETNTYSLSKLQFYLWTAAALVGYAYLTICRSLVRGDFTFAEVPGGLPSLLLITTGTSALAVGITSAKGSKGAGEHHPSASDLVTSGGLVAPERLQFLVWTIVGVLSFVVLALSTSPADIEHLPSIPEGFLALMGVSSVGYLGGKVARKAGPVIKRVEATLGSLVLHIDGTNLSPDAQFRVDDQDVMPSMLDPVEHPSGRPTIIAAEDQPGFARTLLLKLANPAAGWTRLPDAAGKDPAAREGAHSLTIVNPDGQRAVWSFVITPPPAQDPEQVTAGAPAPTPQAGGTPGSGGVPGVQSGGLVPAGTTTVTTVTTATTGSTASGSTVTAAGGGVPAGASDESGGEAGPADGAVQDQQAAPEIDPLSGAG